MKGIKNGIKINGQVLDAALLIDDPHVKKTYTDASGQRRHVRSFSKPASLKAYVRRHPEGIIVAGAGNLFFLEPVPVSAAMIRFDETGSADIRIRRNAICSSCRRQIRMHRKYPSARSAAGASARR